jgi:hypothetical protein
MSRLNIHELHRKINLKNEKKSVCYEKVLEICHKRIISSTEREKTSTLFEFPEYILGYPLFDLNACMEYCKKQLCSNGFLIEYYFPNKFYISWDYEEIKNKKAEQRKQIPLIAVLPNTTRKLPLNNQDVSQIYPSSPSILPTIQYKEDIPSLETIKSKHTPSITNIIKDTRYQSTPISVIQQNTQNTQNTQSTQSTQSTQLQPSQLAQPQQPQQPFNNNLFSPKFHDKITAPIPTSPPKYDPFDVYNIKQTSMSNNKSSVIDNTFFSGNLKQMLSSSIGSSHSVFDFKPSGKLSLNL